MIGGPLTEVAILNAGSFARQAMQQYLRYAQSLGFTHLEFSDGSIYVPDDRRGDIIKMCIDEGFIVISEVGKKDPEKDALISLDQRIRLMNNDLENSAEMVIIEARESGKGVGVMNKCGEVDFMELDAILEVVGIEKTMIEAPEKAQQQVIFSRYGSQANIGNVQPRDALSVAALLRSGLRGDTISVLRKDDWKRYHDAINAPDDYKVY